MGQFTFLILILVVSNAYITSSSTSKPTTINRCKRLETSRGQFELIQELIRKRGYNKDVRPTTVNNTATEVVVDFFLGKVVALDFIRGRLKVDLIFRQRWQDDRLDYHKEVSSCEGQQDLSFYNSVIRDLWTPKLYMPNDLEFTNQSLYMPDVVMKIWPHGTILLSERMVVTLGCPGIGRGQDYKECNIRFKVHGNSSSNLQLKWKKDDPVFILPSNNPTGFRFSDMYPEKCDAVTKRGKYSCEEAQFIIPIKPSHGTFLSLYNF